MGFQHQYPNGDIHELNLDWLIQTMIDFINSEREAGNTPTISSVRSYFTHQYPYGDVHELNLDWLVETALRMQEIGDSVEGDVGELKTRMTAAEGNISTLDNTVSGLTDSVDQIETEIGNINDDVDALETTTAQHTTQIAALDAKIDSQVVANPSGAATDTLDTIEIAGTVYGVEGSGGSEVEANPAGEPTDTLETIGIDGTVYDVGGSEPVSKTATGNPINITDAASAPIVSGVVTFEPVQDLHGYDKPWAGGAGKNLFDYEHVTIDDYPNTSGTVQKGCELSVEIGYTYSVKVNADENIYLFSKSSDTVTLIGDIATARTFTAADNTIYYLRNATNISADNFRAKLQYVQLEKGSTATPYAPYSNICPIEGYTDCEVEVADDATTPTVTNTYTIDLDGTRYGGKVYPVTGKMSVGMGRIASYAGETIGEPWLSDRDEYVAGTTPSIGAEVVYTLASPTIVQLTPEQIRTLKGTNNISTNMTGMSLEYITQDYQPLVELIEQSAGHHYSTQERVVGTWFGKPLYEKSFQVTTPSSNSSTNLVEVTDLNIDYLKYIDGTVKNVTTDNVGATSASGDFILWLRYNYENTGKAYIATQVKYSGYYNQTMYITIRYTKTTD